jgi:nucleoid DNA-binding protein
MNKQELISAIASAANLSTVEAACALDSFFL